LIYFVGQLAEVDTNLIKVCLQNLLYYKVVKLVPIFQYSNTYATTPEIHKKLITGDPNFKNECIEFVARLEHVCISIYMDTSSLFQCILIIQFYFNQTLPHFSDIVRFYCDMKRGVTIKDLCSRYRTIPARPGTQIHIPSISDCGKYSDHSLSSSTHSQSPKSYSNPVTPIRLRAVAQSQSQFYNTRFQQEAYTILNVIDERHLVLFGLVHGFVRRIDKYPVLQLNQQRHSSFSLTASSCKYTGPEDHTGKDNLLKHRRKYAGLYTMFSGEYSYDEICLGNEISQTVLDEMIERDPDVVVIWK